MAPPPPNDLFRTLVQRGLIAAHPAPQPLARGNADRRPDLARSSWRANRRDGTALKLTVGHDLADLARRQEAFAAACGELVAAPAFFERTDHGDALAEPFFDGVTVGDALAGKPADAGRVVAGLVRAEAALAATRQPSTDAERRAEWQTWTTEVLALRCWTEPERHALQIQVLPQLLAQLEKSSPPATRWSNGDFTPENLLIDARGRLRLVDMEFAARTHFFPEDAVRFTAFHAAIRALSPLPPPLATPSLAWHLFFWFRQILLEERQNSPAYAERMRDSRRETLRRLVEQVTDGPSFAWSARAAAIEYRIEETRWVPDYSATLVLRGWVHAPRRHLEAVAVFDDTREIIRRPLSARPDVAGHFNLTETLAGFELAVPLGSAGRKLILAAVSVEGIVLPFHTLATGQIAGRPLQFEGYAEWATQYDAVPPPPNPPSDGSRRFSILVPVYNPPAEFLRACLESVVTQYHPHWELLAVDDGSQAPHVWPLLSEFAARDQRIRLVRQPANGGIARATNAALESARGEFIVLLDHDDVLRPHALSTLAQRLADEPALDGLYSDEDKISADGKRVRPLFKPDFSPEFLLGVMYPGHVLCVRTTVARAAGGFLSEYDGIQDYEFLLRVSALTPRIGHVARILYHWRQSPTSSALAGNVKGDMDARQLAAVRAHLRRTGDPREALALGGHRVRLRAPSTGPTFVIAGSAVPKPVDGLPCLPLPADWAPLRALHHACAASSCDVIILLGVPPVEASHGWAKELAAAAARPDAGWVAPLLLGRDGRVLAAGWTAGPGGYAPLLRGFHPDDDGYDGSLACNREVAAVSPECAAIRRTVAVEVLARLGPDASWMDVCARLRAMGNFHRTCPAARLRFDLDALVPIAGTTAEPDPFLNPHFDSRTADYALAATPAPAVQFHVDEPADWQVLPRCLIVRGWVFAALPIQGVRLRSGQLDFPGAVGLPRPDVRTALPFAGDHTGFEIRAMLPAGTAVPVVVEVQLADGSWRELLTQSSRVPRRRLPLWLGGGDWKELMFFQMPAHMAYPPRAIRGENFPAAGSGVRPKMAIVTPSYNQARFLGDTIRSVLDQRGVSLQYVIQDGGSTDGSVELIRRHASGLQAWASAPDAGQADAIAKGFARTSGGPDDVMAWINSDDFYVPGALAFVADYFSRHPDVDVIYGHRIVVNAESQEVARWFLPAHDPAVLRLNDFVPQETLFWRRRIWDRVGGIDAGFKFAMDWDLLLRFQAAGARIERVPYFLACFRVHAAQKTTAAMHDVGQREITQLRERAQGRPFPAAELERHPRLLRYLRRSALAGFLWERGIRVP